MLDGDCSAALGLRLAGNLLATERSQRVFVANDQMALGVLRALHEAGYGFPSQISVVGYDDQPEAAYFTPPLTTVNQDFVELGRRSLRLLLEMMESGGEAPPVAARW